MSLPDPAAPRKPRVRRITGWTIERIIDFLRGAAKQRWLEKWARWIDKLLDNYDVEDVQEVLGISDVWDLESLEKLLYEHCHGLTEEECFKKIEEMIREKGYTQKLTEEIAQNMMNYINELMKRPEEVYALPWQIRSEIQEIRARPEMDGAKVFKLVYDYLVSEGVEPEEARKVAQEIAATIPKIPPAQRPQVVETAVKRVGLLKQIVLDRWLKARKKAEQIVAAAVEDIGSTTEQLISQAAAPAVAPTPTPTITYPTPPPTRIVEVAFDQLKPRFNIDILPAQRTWRTEETVNVIRNWARYSLRLNPVPKPEISFYDLVGMTVVFYPTQKPEKCYIETDEKMTFKGCDKPVIAYFPYYEGGELWIAVYQPYRK